MVRLLRHRQTKGAATDRQNLRLPRHISTLPCKDEQSSRNMDSGMRRTDRSWARSLVWDPASAGFSEPEEWQLLPSMVV
jgi:hypothetical protein